MRNEKEIQVLRAADGPARLTIPVTIYKGTKKTEVYKYVSLSELFKSLYTNNTRSKILSDKLKHCYKTDKIQYAKLKENLFGFSIGKFARRTDRDIYEYAPLLVFDVDGVIEEKDTALLLEKCKACPFVFAAFPSVSGYGLRILVWCDSLPDTHKDCYKSACEMLAEFLEIKTDKELRMEQQTTGVSPGAIKPNLKETPHIDTSTSNLSRFWFFAHVEKSDFYLNPESEVFKTGEGSATCEQEVDMVVCNSPKVILIEEKVMLCKAMLKRRSISPGRNNFVFALAKTLYEHGVCEKRILKECMAYAEPDFAKSEIAATVNSALKSSVFKKYSNEQLLRYRDIANKADRKKVTVVVVDTNEMPEEKLGKPKRKNKFQQIKAHLSKKYDFRLNEISIELESKLKADYEYSELNDNNLIVEFLDAGFSSVERMLIALLRSDFVPRYNPFEEYFNTLPGWDKSQPDYITELAGYVKARDQEWFTWQFKKMLVRSAACALNIIPFNKHCFTIIGKQNDGKTSFLRFLCPPILENYIQENLDIHSKDGRIALCQNLFINLDELANFSKYDINRTKAFFTIGKVKERLPYDKKASNHFRRASFLASTNSDEFLTDETGNVRWLVFEIDDINHDNGGPNGYNWNIDIDLVYSQVYTMLRNGFDFKLTSDEIAKSEKNNKNYQVITVEQELIQAFFEPVALDEEGEHVQFITSTDILRQLESKTNTKIILRNIGKAMKILGFEQKRKRVDEIDGVKLSRPQPRRGFLVRKIRD